MLILNIKISDLMSDSSSNNTNLINIPTEMLIKGGIGLLCGFVVTCLTKVNKQSLYSILFFKSLIVQIISILINIAIFIFFDIKSSIVITLLMGTIYWLVNGYNISDNSIVGLSAVEREDLSKLINIGNSLINPGIGKVDLIDDDNIVVNIDDDDEPVVRARRNSLDSQSRISSSTRRSNESFRTDISRRRYSTSQDERRPLLDATRTSVVNGVEQIAKKITNSPTVQKLANVVNDFDKSMAVLSLNDSNDTNQTFAALSRENTLPQTLHKHDRTSRFASYKNRRKSNASSARERITNSDEQ